MTTNWSKRTHAEWTRAIVNGDYDTVGVLKFDNGRHIERDQAKALYKAYWHKVDRTIFGRAADKGYGVKRWCFSELGSDGNNLHLHFVATSPFNVLPFCAVLNGIWSNFHARTADYGYNWITPIRHRSNSAAYTAKSTKKLGEDNIGLAVNFQPDPELQYGTFDAAAQARRIENRLTDQQLEQASQALKIHIIETEKRLLVRHQKNSTLRSQKLA